MKRGRPSLGALACAFPLVAACGAGQPDSGPAQPQSAPASRTAQTAQPLDLAREFGLPPARPQAQSRGFYWRAEVRFDAAPAEPHVLEIVHVFPQRALWRLRLDRAGTTQRSLEHWLGTRVFQQSNFADTPAELRGKERAQVLRRMVLREAVLAWPDGRDWRAEPSEPRRLRSELIDPGDSGSIGSLEVELGSAERPERAGARAPDGELQEELRVIHWTQIDARWWPERLEVWVQGQRVWVETCVKASAEVEFLDEYFLPTGFRAQSAAGADER